MIIAVLLGLAFAAEYTPVLFTDMNSDSAAFRPLMGSTPWQPPDYSKQPGALGYGANTFQIPPGMEDRVQFWKEIYVRYTTDQGLFHDSLYTNVMYEPVDFGEIMKNSSLNLAQKEKARRAFMESIRSSIRERLVRLQSLKNSSGLEGEDLRYWKMFEKINDPDKFKSASEEGRLRFQLGQKDRFIQGIFQSGRYLSQMEQIFREEGVPIELTRLPFVESSFNLKARSRVGASGVWQFMKSAAKQYLHMSLALDERNDPLKATRAAAKKLRFNFQMLQTWPLAVTAYNRGPSGVKRLVDANKTKNLSELLNVRTGRFGFASASFYASFLAALETEAEAITHYGMIYRMSEMKGGDIVLKKPLNAPFLLGLFYDNSDMARDYNPHLSERFWKSKTNLPPKSFIRVPLEKYDEALAALAHPNKIPIRTTTSAR